MDEDFSEDAMIALLPINSDWSKLDLPHMTLAYAGKIADLGPTMFNEMAKAVSSIAMMSPPITVRVMGPDIFGDEEKVDVLRLQPTQEVMAMREMVKQYDVSDHSFRPHVTIGPMGSFVQNVPSYIAFDRIYVGWGDRGVSFWLRRQYG